MKPNQIPVSTTGGDPKWFHNNTYNQDIIFIDKNNVINGVRESLLSFPKILYNNLSEHCSRNCLYKSKVPNCQFMINYRKHLDSLNFETILKEFERICFEAKKINNYEGEGEIILIVYETPKVNCAERPVLKSWFKDHGINLIEWDPKESI